MNILIIRVSSIGDVIHTLPAFFLIKHNIPHARISWVVQEKAASLLKHQQFLEHLWILPNQFVAPRNIHSTIKTIKVMQTQQWDAIIDFQGLLKTSLLYFSLSGKKFGFDWNNAREPVSSLCTQYRIQPNYCNIIQKNLALASAVCQTLVATKKDPTIDILRQSWSLHIPDSQKHIVNSWISTHKLNNIIALCPNTTWPSKRWPLVYWQELLMTLTANKEYSVVLIGKDFGNDAASIAHFAGQNGTTLYNVPSWDLLTMTYFLQRISLLVAPDTSFLHLADFLGTPAVGIFGPTLKQRHGPLLYIDNINFALQAPCPHRYQKTHNFENGKHIDCMMHITPTTVNAKIATFLKKNAQNISYRNNY